MTDRNILIADIGGTNARFALAGKKPGSFSHNQVFQCADYEDVEQALRAYIKAQNIDHLDALCFAAAGPIENNSIRMTNNHWVIDMNQLAEVFGARVASLLNDFEAISYSLPQLQNDQLIAIGGDWSMPEGEAFNLGVVGPGSGLGVGGLLKRDGSFHPLINEAGHAGFAPENKFQADLLNVLFGKYSRVSNERLLSGPGIVNMYRAVCHIKGQPSEDIDAGAIGQLAAQKSNPECSETFDLFFEMLGQVAGDIALTMGAFDGIYIGGGICQRYPQLIANSRFRYGFERKGRHSHLLERTPTWLITEPNPGLIGASSHAQSFFS